MSKLIKDSMLYVFGGFLVKSFGLILIPLYTRVLSVDEYGLLSLLNVVLQLLSIIFAFGISSASLRYSFSKENELSREKVYGNSIILQIVSWPVMILFVVPLVYVIFNTAYPYIQFYPLILIIVFSASFLPIRNIWESLLRAQKRSRLFVTWAIILFVTQTLTIILFVSYFKMGLIGIFAAQLIINFVFGLIAIVYLKNYSTFSFSKSLSKKLLVFGIPLIPYSIFLWIESASSRILLEKYTGLREVGLFAVAFQFAGILKILTNHLDNALLPNFYELAEKENREISIGRFQLKYFFFITSFAAALYFISKPLLLIAVDRKFHEAVIYLPWLIIAFWISDLTKIFKWNLLAVNKSNTVSILQAFSTMLTILLFILLLNFFNSVTGIVLAMFLTFSIMLFTYYYVSQRSRRISTQPTKLLLILSVLIIPCIVSFLTGFLNSYYLSSLAGLITLVICSYYLMASLKIINFDMSSFLKLKLFSKG